MEAAESLSTACPRQLQLAQLFLVGPPFHQEDGCPTNTSKAQVSGARARCEQFMDAVSAEYRSTLMLLICFGVRGSRAQRMIYAERRQS